MRSFLSPRELARTIGASESSLKRWADEGRLEVGRTAGGHRRIALREALRFIRQSHLPIVDPQALGVADAAHMRSAGAQDADATLVQALLGGNVEETRGSVMGMYLMGREVAEICDGPLAQAMHEVGALWKHGPEGIHAEHRTTDLCAQTLQYLRALLPAPGPKAPLALGGALESDPYMLPSLMVAATLASRGWREINFGPNLPFDALRAAVDAHCPRLVWLSCSIPGLADQRGRELRETARLLREGGIQLIVGGRGWSTALLADSSIESVHQARTLGELAAFAEGLRHTRHRL